MSFLLKALTKEPNPVGLSHEVPEVEEMLVALADQWDNEILKPAKKKWYEHLMFWRWGTKVSLSAVTKFLIGALDDLIGLIDDKLELGPDKKATVLDAIDRLYEYVVREALPIILRPITGKVKNYIVYTLISVAIDWIVDKYRNGEWRDVEEGDAIA